VYVTADGGMQAAPFDLASKRVTGPAVPLAANVSSSGTGIAQFAVSRNGVVAYIPEEPRSLVLVDRTGAARPATPVRRNFHAPRFSPDGRRLSLDFTSNDGRDVWLLSLDDGTLSRATFDGDGHDANWTPEGQFITYLSLRRGTVGLYRTRPGTAAPAESLFASSQIGYAGLWLPDRTTMVVTGVELRPGSGNDIALLRNGGRGPIEPVVATPYTEWHPSVSPDGRWIAFDSDQSGQTQVYVRSLQADATPVQVSQDGGIEPLWAPDGRELFYRRSGEGEPVLIAAELRFAPELQVVSRRVLFGVADIVGASPHVNYDISPDGKTFAMVRRSPATRIVVLQNLPELIRRSRDVVSR